MCGAPELLRLLGMVFHPCQLPSSLLRQSHKLVICINTASLCPPAQHISDLCFEVFLLQSQGKKVALEWTATGQLDQPPAQTWAGFRIASEPLQVGIYKLQEQVHSLLEYISLGLPTLLAKKLGFALFFKPSHEQMGDI